MCAAQVVLRKAHNSGEIAGEVKAKINEFASRGFRALGLAIAEGDTGEGKCVATTPGGWCCMHFVNC